MPKSYQIQCTHGLEVIKTPNMDLLDAKAVFFDCQFKTDVDQIEILHGGRTIFRAQKYSPTPIIQAWIVEEVK